ncbi:MAG: hypothetical protein QOF60_354 [Actinomycetota bacterium]|nr:hypothetical protein [Actinomycetota bacterium]
MVELADPAAGWGSKALRRATVTLAVTQLVSWGVLFYGFAVVAPDVTADTGWSESVVSGAFAVGLLVAGLAAPAIARTLGRRDPRLVLSAGSIAGVAGMVAFAFAPNVAVLYVAWVVVGLAMAATLYEPAMAVLVAIDPSRRHRTLAAVTVAGGLASTAFAPLFGWAATAFGWRAAIAVVAVAGGAFTLTLHAIALPPAHVHMASGTSVTPLPAPPFDRPLRRLLGAQLFENAAILATTVHFTGFLLDRGVNLATAAAALGIMGLGKVGGRLLLLGPLGRGRLAALAAGANAVQAAGLALPLFVTGRAILFPAMVVVGAGSGATTVLRPLLVVELVGPAPFAAVNARLQRATTLARAAAPFVLGAAVAATNWPTAWALALVAFVLAAERYLALSRL